MYLVEKKAVQQETFRRSDNESFKRAYSTLSGETACVGDVESSNRFTRNFASALLAKELDKQMLQSDEADDVPSSIADMQRWMLDNTARVNESYAQYLEARKSEAKRRFFANRAHAMYVLRNLAPTKLVDGAWLYGLTQYAKNPKFTELVRTYCEELGDGQSDKNHVLLYRELLSGLGVDVPDDLPDDFYAQGAIQLALAHDAEEFLPELIGFNLGYEQLPLHLLITSYELNELGIDPYYFTLHVTVDNADTGHARRAIQAVLDNVPQVGSAPGYFRRVQAGCRLASSHTGTMQIIESFDIEREVTRIFARKSVQGSGAHSDYCKIGGRLINDWLSDQAQIPAFMQALQKQGWIKRNEAPAESRFWNLLQGPRAEMFGVFSPYELQVIHDWIRGDAATDGLAYSRSEDAGQAPKRQPSFRAAKRRMTDDATLQSAGMDEKNRLESLMDPDLHALKRAMAEPGSKEIVVRAMSPSNHWTPSGLYATRALVKEMFGA